MKKSRFKFFLVVLILLFLFSFRLWQTTGCRQFRSFYLNPQAVIIKVEEDVGTDKKDSSESSLRFSSLDKLGTAGLRGIDRNISRFFHNKYQSMFVLTTGSVTSLFATRLLLDLLGPLGLAAFATSVVVTIKTKNLAGLIHLVLIFLAAMFAIFTPQAKQTFYLYSITLYSFSFWSTKLLAKLPILLILAFTVVSFWYFSFSWQLEAFCHEVFFN